MEDFKGPTVFSSGRETLIAQDMLILKPGNGGEVRWVACCYAAVKGGVYDEEQTD